MIFTFLGLIAAGLVASFAFDDGDDGEAPSDPFGNFNPRGDGDDGDEDPDTPPEEDSGELMFTGDAILLGTEGDDTLSDDQDEDLAPGSILLGGGDDTATLNLPLDIEVSGGEGDDTISSATPVNTLNGGEGNDVLSGQAATSMDGGEGNDQITSDMTGEINDSVAAIYGGEGEDRIVIQALTGVDQPDLGGAVIHGGGGPGVEFDDTADEFVVELELQSSAEDLDGNGRISNYLGTISDFNPDVDTLTIDITDEDGDSEERSVSSISLTQTEDEGIVTSELAITYAATEEAAASITSLTIITNQPFELEDIQFNGL